MCIYRVHEHINTHTNTPTHTLNQNRMIWLVKSTLSVVITLGLLCAYAHQFHRKNKYANVYFQLYIIHTRFKSNVLNEKKNGFNVHYLYNTRNLFCIFRTRIVLIWILIFLIDRT